MTFEKPCKSKIGAWLVAVETLSAYYLGMVSGHQ